MNPPSYIAKLIERCAHDGLCTAESIMSRSRASEAVRARHRVWHIIHSSTGMSISGIGRMFGADHTTVMYGIRRHEERLRA